MVAQYQPAKAEAIEGNWTSTNTGYNLFVIPDVKNETNKVQITLPLLGSFIARDLSGNTPTPGMLNTPKDDRPNVWTVFWGFRAMFYSSMLIFAAAMTGVVLRLRRRLYEATWFHKFVLWLTPVGIVAILGGWVTAETGRQPWVVYGQLRTTDAVSHLAPGELIFTVLGFMTIYLSLLTAFIVYVARTIRRGPERDDPRLQPPDPDGLDELAEEPEVEPVAPLVEDASA